MEAKLKDFAWTVVQLAQLAKRLEAQWKELGWEANDCGCGGYGYYGEEILRAQQLAADLLDLTTHELESSGQPVQEPGVPDEEYVRTLLGKPQHFSWEDYVGWVEVLTGSGDWSGDIVEITEECRRNACYFEQTLKGFTTHRAGWEKMQELLHYD